MAGVVDYMLKEQKAESPITTHILDTSSGKPATGVRVELRRLDAEGATQQTWSGETNADGRVKDLIEDRSTFGAGIYQLKFHTKPYFGERESFYPFVEITFEIDESQTKEHFHVPLLLNPFGYSTYRGS